MTEVQRERGIDEMLAPAASMTWQGSRPLTLREREVLHQAAADQPGYSLAHDSPISLMTVSHRIATVLNKLRLRKRTPALNQVLPDSLPGAAASSEGSS
jgi:DNA-binding NarL/FixJ family response regulator